MKLVVSSALEVEYRLHFSIEKLFLLFFISLFVKSVAMLVFLTGDMAPSFNSMETTTVVALGLPLEKSYGSF